MTSILAAIDASAAARPVLETAAGLGRALRLPVVAFHARLDGDEVERLLAEAAGVELRVASGPPVEAIVAATAEETVALCVLGVRGLPSGRRPGSTALAVAARATKPLVVVPPLPRDPPAGLRRVLVPLDGTPAAAAAVEQATRWLAGSGMEIVGLHVFDLATVPRFWDRPEHDQAAWAREFLARWYPAPGSRLELRAGRPGGRVLEVAAAERADLIALGWSQHLDPDRAAVVREVLTGSDVPVLLLPAHPRQGRTVTRTRWTALLA
jgi:nucleotide-binding universal stress UspA family protein